MIQNPLGARPGGTATALGLNSPTIIKATSGTLWSANVLTLGENGGGLYDSNVIPPPPQSLIWNFTAQGAYPGQPIAFANGLVYVSSADTVTSVGYA